MVSEIKNASTSSQLATLRRAELPVMPRPGFQPVALEGARPVSKPSVSGVSDRFIRFSGEEQSKPAITREQERLIRRTFGWHFLGIPRGDLNTLINQFNEDIYQWYPLHCAVALGYLDVAQALIAAGANLHQRRRGFLPIHLVHLAGGKRLDMTEMLIKAGSPVNGDVSEGLSIITRISPDKLISAWRAEAKKLKPPLKPSQEKLLRQFFGWHFLGIPRGNLSKLIRTPNSSSMLWKGGELPIHRAAALGRLDLVQALITAGSPINILYSGGFPIHGAAENGKLDVVKALIEAGAFIDEPTADGSLPIHLAAKNGHLDVVKALTDAESSTVFNINSPDILLDRASTNPEAWVKLLPFIFEGSIPLNHLESVTTDVEIQMHRDKLRKQHDNAAELMASLKSPALGEDIHNRLSSALSSVFHWINKNLKVTGQHLNIWGDLGLLSHGFKFWKYDAQGKENSLFAKYGCESVQVNETNRRFGNGFYFEKALNPHSKLDAQTKVLLLRGVLLISHPEYGTLAVRNSSLAFGRDLLKQPACYTNETHNTKQALAQLPNTIEGQWTSVLDWQLERQKKYDHVEFLTNQLLQFKQDYQFWKFNTTQFDENQQFTGHQNGGLKAMAEWLKSKQELNDSSDNQKPLPSLAFVHPQYPPYASYAFTNAAGEQVDTLPMTPTRIEELLDFVNGTWSSQEYPNSSLQNFMQEGIQQHGSLILVDADEH